MGQLYNNISYYLEPADLITIFERILNYVVSLYLNYFENLEFQVLYLLKGFFILFILFIFFPRINGELEYFYKNINEIKIID